MNQIALVYVAMIFLFASAVDADAKRFRFFAVPGFSRGETIDRVYDLPNQTTFVVEGKFFDLGYLNSSSGDAYVLYNGDQYVKLDEVGLKGISSMLGFDPTVEDRKKRAAASEAAEPIGRLIGGFVLLVGLFVLLRRGIRWYYRSGSRNARLEREDIEAVVELPEPRPPIIRQQRAPVTQDYTPALNEVAPPTRRPEAAPNRAGMAVRPFGRRNA